MQDLHLHQKEVEVQSKQSYQVQKLRKPSLSLNSSQHSPKNLHTLSHQSLPLSQDRQMPELKLLEVLCLYKNNY